ncbi:MAG TPA: aldehyde dehydrogenase family protein [Thermoplasmata archaeon]|nr:aldehyde dehydrogenase family protein [Thermoplasmata archaeon]
MSASAEPAYDHFIGGQSVPGTSGHRQTLLDPASNRPIGSVALGTKDDARHALEVAERAFESSGWAGDDGSRRSKVLHRLAAKLEERLEEFALLESRNMGKTLKEARFDIGFIVRTLEYSGGLADKIEGETIPVPGARLDFTLLEPLGVTVHIAPWNYPLLLAVRSVAPALAAGNTVVLKPATLTPLTALAFASLAKEAGVPDGVLNVVAGPGAEIGEALVADPRCRCVAFTGSGEVGRRIGEIAGRRVIPAHLELGGKGPVIVFPDADLDRAARGVAFGIFGNAGQMCWAGSRLVAHQSIVEPLLGKIAQIAKGYKLGPGTSEGVDMGPLVSKAHLDGVLGFVEEATAAGARLVTGGARPSSGALAEGNFLEPTVVSDAPADARLVRDEVFGPVLSTTSFTEADDAVRIANDTRYGLFASLWTKDLGLALGTARRLDAGMIGINESPTTFPQSPFGGFKESGLGFEQGRRAVQQYSRRKNVLVNLAAPKPKR